jgi:NADH-quinone oxidoreductase subunit H
MQFGWKVLIPVSILWILVVATLRVLTLENASTAIVVAFASTVVFIFLAINVSFENVKKKKSAEVPEGDNKSEPSFAVPSLPTLPIEISTINVSKNSGGNRD